MAELQYARASHAYTFQGKDGEKVLLLLRRGWIMLAPVERTWETRRGSFDFVGRAYGGEVAQGNARLTMSYEVCLRRSSEALLERDLLRLERELNLHPHGTLTIREAYADGAPLLVTDWEAHIAAASTRAPLPLDEAPPIAGGAWGALRVELILTNPQER